MEKVSYGTAGGIRHTGVRYSKGVIVSIALINDSGRQNLILPVRPRVLGIQFPRESTFYQLLRCETVYEFSRILLPVLSLGWGAILFCGIRCEIYS